MIGEEPSCQPTPSDLSKATDLLQSLIQIDTSNPPGDVEAAFDLVHWELQAAGISAEVVGPSKESPNIVAKLAADPENRKAPPLVLSCHLDVVPVPNPENWQHPPFSGEIADGCVWGRGAIDMKGFAVMALTALLVIKQSRLPINRDLIFVAVCDEEIGTDNGSRWLVENRPDLLESPEYVINEVGGFTVHRKGRRFYPVQVAEKGVAWLRMTTKGTPGHSSLPLRQSCLNDLAKAVTKINDAALPWHVTPEAKRFLEGFSQFDSDISQTIARLLYNRLTGRKILKLIPDKGQRASVEAILRNTATPTRIQASQSINSLPHQASVDLDGRTVPGQSAENLIKELRKVLHDKKGKRFDFEILKESPGVTFPIETPLFSAIESTMVERDSEGVVVPSIISGFTDSHNYAKIGAICYGFYPLKLEEELNFAAMFHGDNERIPIEGFHWGIETLVKMLSTFLVE